MYGSLHDDPIIKYYDISFALGSPDEIPWYIRKATQYGSPVLDLACGTGRLALEFARNGMQVVALDSSEGMIEIFKEKLSREPAAIRNRIHIERQSMNNFNLTKDFQTIVCCDAFFHNLTLDDERACLKAINRHLRPAGYFLFNIHYNPNPEFLRWASSAEAVKFHKRAEYLIPNTCNTLYIEESISHDALNQLIDTKLRFEVKDEKGNVIDQSASGWQSRYLCKYEAIYLLELCGFSVESIVGDYRDQPVSIKSQLIFTARKQKDIG